MTINQQLIRDEIKDYILLTLGLTLYAAAFTVFLMPYQIVTGGVTGLSAIIFYATQFKLENTYMIINVVLLGGRTEDTGIQVHDEDHLRYLCTLLYADVCTGPDAC